MKIYILKQWVSKGYWENVKATTDEWEAGHWVEGEGVPDMNHDYDEFEIEEKRN